MESIKSASELSTTLRQLGANKYDLILPESKALISILQTGEQIQGIIFGRYTKMTPDKLIGRGAMVATNKRVLLVDKKPLFKKYDEIIYEVVSGITHAHIGFSDLVTLHTRLGDIDVRTFNNKAAQQFKAAIEDQLFSRQTRPSISSVDF